MTRRILILTYENDVNSLAALAQKFSSEGYDVRLCIADFFSPLTNDFAVTQIKKFGFDTNIIYDFKEALYLINRLESLEIDFDYLKRIEQQFTNHITLSQLILCDYHLSMVDHSRRTVNLPRDKDVVLKLLELLLKKIETIFDSFVPDVIFTYGNNHIVKNLFYYLSKTKKVLFLSLDCNRIGFRYSILENFWIGPSAITEQQINCLREKNDPCKEAVEFISLIRNTATQAYDNDTLFGLNTDKKYRASYQFKAIFLKLKSLVNYLVGFMINTNKKSFKKLFYQERSQWVVFWNEYIKKIYTIRRFLRDKNLNCTEIAGQPYVLVMLHVIPENGIFSQPTKISEVEMIKQVAKCLPVTHKLLVKPNPRMLLMNSDAHFHSVYREINNLHNVNVLSISIPSPNLIKNAKAVVALAGTSLLEAALNKVPAFAFANPEFIDLHGIFRFDPLTFQSMVETFKYQEDNNQKYFIQALINNGLDINFSKYGTGDEFTVCSVECQEKYITPIYQRIEHLAKIYQY
jgi:hypothetical protein